MVSGLDGARPGSTDQITSENTEEYNTQDSAPMRNPIKQFGAHFPHCHRLIYRDDLKQDLSDLN